MSIEKVNVDQKLAQIKAMGGDKNKIDSAQEQFKLSVFYNEVNLNPQKYSYEDRQKVNKSMAETKLQLIEKMFKEMIKSQTETSEFYNEIINLLDKLLDNKHKITQGEINDEILDKLNTFNAICDEFNQLIK